MEENRLKRCLKVVPGVKDGRENSGGGVDLS